LENTPSVYVSKSGGGTGDSRINIRGFDQTNISVMVNGVPVNDMETSAVFWSNWSGLAEIGGQIQVQRGLGNSKLSTPAVGGNINVVTKASEMRAGTMINASVGNDGFEKTSVGFSTGKSKKGLAFSMLVSHQTSDGYVRGTASEVYNYFGTMAWEINNKSTLTATVTGAPQWHDQRGTALPYQTYYGNPYDTTVKVYGPRYNNTWGYYHGSEFNMNKNFYHKPVANINYYYKISPKTELSAVLYGSIGRGGGTSYSYSGNINNSGGNSILKLNRDADNLIRFDDVESWNRGDSVKGLFGGTGIKPGNPTWKIAGPYLGEHVLIPSSDYVKGGGGINRIAAMNEHNWYGTIINLTHKLNSTIVLDGGLDIRIYKGLHYRRVQDALGSDAYLDYNSDVNNPFSKYVAAGDRKTKIVYANDDYVKQYGGYLGGSYEKNKLSIFVSSSFNTTSYQRLDYFLYKSSDPIRKTREYYFNGFSAKGGVGYRFNNNHFAFANIGYFEKPLLFGNVFTGNSNTNIPTNLKDQNTLGEEIGYNYRSSIINVTINLYHTIWKNKSLTPIPYTDANGVTTSANINGVTEDHKGIELESTIKPIQKLEVNVMGSLGDWRYKNTVSATIYNADNTVAGTTTVFLKDVKVGSTAQQTLGLGARYELMKGLSVRANYRYSGDLYATFAVKDRQTGGDTTGRQAWQLPNYGVVNAAISYNFKIEGKKINLGLNVDNILDNQYIAESLTDVLYNSTVAKDFIIGKNGSGKNNTVYPGFGRTWVISAKVYF
jgi:outer membrane cobalamin receptor